MFGSAARGDAQPGISDLHFLVEFQPEPPGGDADAYFGLSEALQELFGRPVDLVVPSAIRNPFFRESVEWTKVLLMRLEAMKYLYDMPQGASLLAEFVAGHRRNEAAGSAQ